LAINNPAKTRTPCQKNAQIVPELILSNSIMRGACHQAIEASFGQAYAAASGHNNFVTGPTFRIKPVI